jgi:hypothetical protein
MAIFGRSKKKKAPPAPECQIYYSPAHEISPPPYHGPPRPQLAPAAQSNQLVYNNPPSAPGWTQNPPHQPYNQITISQTYNIPVISGPPRPKSSGKITRLKGISVADLLQADIPPCIPGAQIFNDGLPLWQTKGTQYLNQAAALYDIISTKLDAIVTAIDAERFSGSEGDLVIYGQPVSPPQRPQTASPERDVTKAKSKGVVNNGISNAVISTNYFAKVNLYANSKLPSDLTPVRM